MAVKLYRKTVLTGGTSGALDGIDGAGLNDGDITFVYVTGNEKYEYKLDAACNLSESSPYIITPDSNPGSKRWRLQTLVTP